MILERHTLRIIIPGLCMNYVTVALKLACGSSDNLGAAG